MKYILVTDSYRMLTVAPYGDGFFRNKSQEQQTSDHFFFYLEEADPAHNLTSLSSTAFPEKFIREY